MREFLGKTGRFALIGTVPILFVIGAYIILDPFKVIKTYNPIFLGNVPGEVITSRDYVGTVTLLNNYELHPYDAFIFGNSRSFIFGVEDWKQYLPSEARCFHYNAPSETLYALTKKVEFIDRKGLSMENVLLVLDHGILSGDAPMSGHLFALSPQLVDYENIAEFQLTFLKAFLTPNFLRAYFDFKLTGKLKRYMVESHLLNDATRGYDDVTNELRMDYYEDLIAKGEFFTPERMSRFYERDTIEGQYPQVLADSQKALLKKIRSVFAKHETDYKIIISPGYDQKKLHPDDLAYLTELFEEQCVFDYSGKNHFTEDYRNYYEPIHYRPGVARDIMADIYGKQGGRAVVSKDPLASLTDQTIDITR